MKTPTPIGTFNVLSDRDIERIHTASLLLLSDLGILSEQ
jgi:trimethylamine:corrinoid methyltransferase-like protein